MGGDLRAAIDWLGVEWVYPTQRRPGASAGLRVEVLADGRACRTRGDFGMLGLSSHYHSCLILGFDLTVGGIDLAARYFLHQADALCLRLELRNPGEKPRSLDLALVAYRGGEGLPGGPAPEHVALGLSDRAHRLAPHASEVLWAVLGRGETADLAGRVAQIALEQAAYTYQHCLDEDAAFRATCPVLTGDWPSGWREGLVYDFETTRLLVQPPAGAFSDVWPAWMVSWPRVVLAEGTLDMLRLAYADPALAQRAVLSMFADARQANVPCVFFDGTPNMVAADGSVCGTSPAWCLPFVNLELLYLRTVDRDWLARLYPHLGAYLDWWLTQRVDSAGWLVYKCTWEAGEDGNPRLDPSGSGDADISRRVRPVELQATVAHAAGVLAFFAAELGLAEDARRWQDVQAGYRARTRLMYDPQEQRYRDVVLDTPPPTKLYWGVDASRYSALALTPALIGEPLPVAEVWRHGTPPWTLWPSWTWAMVESAAALDLYTWIGALVHAQIARVYRVTTRRDLGSKWRPMPGAAPEFWPLDWATFDGHDAYGWGATTANLLIRHLFGFKEHRQTGEWVAVLTPALPPSMLQTGRRYGLRRLNYRRLAFDLTYVVTPGGGLLAEIDLGGTPRACQVMPLGASTSPTYRSADAQAVHRFELTNGAAFRLTLG